MTLLLRLTDSGRVLLDAATTSVRSVESAALLGRAEVLERLSAARALLV